ncbi:response regulator transcription factor [Demequina sp. B12]|uniref:response regulator n=1 Tax=Demequina sp. B12 TaxID=2992757 RepID=UPI00237A2462|nr:response regulator transcription factor [Demequina sp. B12]MDE0572247.1 response regulator transcription factor [Demequina sp. B12]
MTQDASGPELTTVIIVDDDPMVRQQVRLVLDGAPHVSIVGEAADGAAAVDLATSMKPHIVLMDVSMPVMTGIDATRALKERGNPARVIALTAMDHDEVLFDMLGAGAVGFVPKEYAGEDLERAIRHVTIGAGFVSPHCQPALFAKLTHTQETAAQREAQELVATLSPREREVAVLIATGAPRAAIAHQLYVSESTIKSQVESIKTKTLRRSREEIAVLVERAGLTRDN